MYTWKALYEGTENRRPRLILGIRYGGWSGAIAIVVAAINFELGFDVEQWDSADTNLEEVITDWAAYIGVGQFPRSDAEVPEVLADVASTGGKIRAQQAVTFFPHIPISKYRA